MGGSDEKENVVYFVGAGPGDPELITVKGRRLLEAADLVVYTGSLVGEQSLCWCRDGAELRSSAAMNLDDIVALMAEAVSEGKRVVRLHTGDPSLYGALGEQTRALDALGVRWETVAGVSSAFAAAASLGRELTMPGVTQTVIFTRLEGRTPVPASENLASLAAHRATVCVFLSAGMIEKVVAELTEGYPPDTPAAVVYRASWKDEKCVVGILSEIAAKTKEAGITRHALIIVGDALGDDLSPEAVSKLYDRDFKHGYTEDRG